METMISSATKQVLIGDDQPTILIGERINPAGKKKMSEALKTGDLEIVRREAQAQAQAGADIIDVCVSTFGVDEIALLPQAIQTVMETVDVPLCIDSAKPEALEAALKIYNGKPLINSVTGEEKSLAGVLPLVKEYKAAVIGLPQDDEGIPNNWERRVAIAHKIVGRAEKFGIPKEDVIIDCLTFTIGADTRSGQITIETVRRIKAELGVNVILGASNISFGLPDRNIINNAFVSIAIAAGVNCLIVDAAKVRPIVLGTDLLLARDKRARRYVEAYRKRQKSFAHL
jgi:5-methyltetrahydrofolate--homocysteine methyltransferase